MFSKPYIEIGQRRWARFHICGLVGLVLAVITAQTLTTHIGLRSAVLVAIAAAAIVTFLVLVMAMRLITGEERIIYYHHEIGVIVVVALLLCVLRQPLLPYLDITILGIGTFLALGRIGCLLVGCCHGRPWRWGVRYGQEHAAAGFPAYLVGVRLFPIQAVESLWVLCTVAIGTFFVWKGNPAGTTLAWYVVVYDAGRFCFEFARGDADRPYWLGFSQPQWISMLLTGTVAGAELASVLPLVGWHIATFALLALAMVGVSLKRRLQFTKEYQLLHPKHVQQVAAAMKSVGAMTAGSIPRGETHSTVVSIAHTSLGIRISGNHMLTETEDVYHYTLSSEREVMTERAARVLAGLIQRLNGTRRSGTLVAGSPGIFHVLIWAP
jgi:hypothetical protein